MLFEILSSYFVSEALSLESNRGVHVTGIRYKMMCTISGKETVIHLSYVIIPPIIFFSTSLLSPYRSVQVISIQREKLYIH